MSTALASRSGGRTADVDTVDTNQIEDLFGYFAEAALTDHDPVPDGRYGLVDGRTVDAVHQSADTSVSTADRRTRSSTVVLRSSRHVAERPMSRAF